MDDIISGIDEQLVLDGGGDDDVSMVDWVGELDEGRRSPSPVALDTPPRTRTRTRTPTPTPTTQNAVATGPHDTALVVRSENSDYNNKYNNNYNNDYNDYYHQHPLLLLPPEDDPHARAPLLAARPLAALEWLLVGVATALVVSWTVDVMATKRSLAARAALRREACYRAWAANSCGRPVPALAAECAQWHECWAEAGVAGGGGGGGSSSGTLWADAIAAVGRRVWPLAVLLLVSVLAAHRLKREPSHPPTS